MKKVITYGTYDLLHYGHIRLLERAKALGDYLIVGVTSDDYDKTRGKINNQQSLMERVAAVKEAGIADEVIIEEYEGQKIDDIKKYGVDIFTVGSDWVGYFDYLNEFCEVVYLPRTEGVSSTSIRTEKNKLSVGIVGNTGSELTSVPKFMKELDFVNGIEVVALYELNLEIGIKNYGDYDSFLQQVDCIYIASHPTEHFEQIKIALEHKKHVLCESPIALSCEEFDELSRIAEENSCILMDANKTAYSTAYERMLLLVKTGKIGDVMSVDSVCTSLKDFSRYSDDDFKINWNTMTEWGPPALLPIFQILGTNYDGIRVSSKVLNDRPDFDVFSKIDFEYSNAVASSIIGKSVKSEGELIISGTKGYIIVPAPWWKTDYFEVRFENPANNRRYFYQLDGEGIRYEIVAFVKAIQTHKPDITIDDDVSKAICKVMHQFYSGKVHYLK